jgi:ATP-dependent DNA ligase
VKPRIAAPVRFPDFIEPMKALTVEKLPEGDWLHEIKINATGALGLKDGKDVRLFRAIKRRSIIRNGSML